MKIHTTNYVDTFIEVAKDTGVSKGNIPPKRARKTVAEMQYELIAQFPYKYTSDELLFKIYAERNTLVQDVYEEAKRIFFSKGQACLRASPLPKKYGFGIHCDHEGKVALYGMETKEYLHFLNDTNIKKVKAMKSNR
ncbi:DUF6157 family protein [Sphingobacterium sp. HMA12]|uniref:DUF6157 family protein n=1 Tax=Sphingobacterium sp. HMA12 TaxID=2050894 RepID=UPI000CEA38B7|nr:DUF6157 family protein [Sphingobacterium sp. HMA12]